MIIFRYDKSFEGLLTALFDAYSRREFPEELLAYDAPAPMFVDAEHVVVTDPHKAARVWGGVCRRVPRQVSNMLMYVWLSEQAGADGLIMRYIRRVLDTPGAEGDFSDPDILHARTLAQKVSMEGQRLGQFVRFQKAADGTFFATVAPRYNSLPIALGYFEDRFKDQRWIIYDVGRRYGYYWDLSCVREITLTRDDDLIGGKLSDELMASDERIFQDMWRGYLASVTIRERINPKLQRQMMPRRYWKYMTEHQSGEG